MAFSELQRNSQPASCIKEADTETSATEDAVGGAIAIFGQINRTESELGRVPNEEESKQLDTLRQLHRKLLQKIHDPQNAKLKAFLIQRGLVDLLKQGQGVPIKAWITFSASNPRITYDEPANANDYIIGGGIIPQNAVEKGKLFEPAKDEVLGYLGKSFGLSRQDAEEIYIRVRNSYVTDVG
jgi:hypothetical protein